jgi:hypothetical protein
MPLALPQSHLGRARRLAIEEIARQTRLRFATLMPGLLQRFSAMTLWHTRSIRASPQILLDAGIV